MEDKMQLLNLHISRIKEILDSPIDTNEKLKTICKLLRDSVPYYDWVGFYLVQQSREKELVLGPFEGEPTEHVKIPFGKGLCSQAAERKETIIVQDVSDETDYLSCSVKVKSEAVIPIFKKGKLVRELDIDSHTLSPFTEEDRRFLEKVCEIVSVLFY